MKLAITDQFLWDMYKLFEKTDKARDFVSTPLHRKMDVLLGLENPVFRKYKNDLGAKKFSKMIYRLKVNNIITVENLKERKEVMITKKGFSKLLSTSFKMDTKEKRKDGKWLMIIFDLPKYHQKSRTLLRSVLQNLGYKILQHSVWVCPFDVSEKTERLLQSYNLDRYVKIFLIEEI